MCALPSFLKLPPDQFLHNLVHAAEDARHARRAPGAGDRIFVHITRTAEELEALVHDLPLKVGVPQLRRGALFGGDLILPVPRARPLEVGPGAPQLRLPLRATGWDVPELDDAL